MTSENDFSFADRVTKCVLGHYEKCISRRGKPRMEREWTLLAAVVMVKRSDGELNLKTVALGTGTKCIGQSKMSKNGDVLNDSHAEVIARRAFLRFLYHEISLVYNGEESEVFVLPASKAHNQCLLKNNVEFQFFMSSTPCGDASIFPMMPEDTFSRIGEICVNIPSQTNSLEEEQIKQTAEEPVAKKFKTDDGICESSCERLQFPEKDNVKHLTDSSFALAEDIFRTGAKCVPFGKQDTYEPGINYHCINALRIKPGRGDRTLSMSCSDKIARWNFLGCQGALLSHFLFEPIYFKSFIIANCPFSVDAAHRALMGRFETQAESLHLSDGYFMNKPNILQSSLSFADNKNNSKTGKLKENVIPCSTTIIWYKKGENATEEIAVNGRKQGATLKSINNCSAHLSISCKALYSEFKRVKEIASKVNKLPLTLKSLEDDSSSCQTYYSHKIAAMKYQDIWNQLLKGTLKTWVKKPKEFMQFL
ncbi:tRNA-specific adenosine deaminase 1 isoform X1 [Octopus vulgaris]|uniref:tRNA-specific adenosine deaminase 1 n=1 Tax=Octopus vulgaris TaxID=6645 RepID=A0AA36AJA1_OCTVU|nr:tRNA-specific adenosine deaminase 1 isoform X1 [Octopus vulgaris]